MGIKKNKSASVKTNHTFPQYIIVLERRESRLDTNNYFYIYTPSQHTRRFVNSYPRFLRRLDGLQPAQMRRVSGRRSCRRR